MSLSLINVVDAIFGRVCVCAILQVSQQLFAFTFKTFLAQGAGATSALRAAEETGRGSTTAATSGEPTRRTGLKLKTSARGRAAIWPVIGH